MLTSSLGHVSVTEVDGTTFTGLYAADGSLNVYDATSDTVPNGLYHPCGAMNITITDGTTLTGRYANNGSLYVVIDSTQYGVYHSCGAMNITGITVSLAEELLGSETDGLAIVAEDMTLVIRDTTTPANAFSGDVNTKLTYTSPSTKYILNSSGVYEAGTTLRCEYDTSGNPLGIRIEETRTNVVLHNRDLTNAVWTKSNVTAAKDQVGIDGVTNSASSLTATAGNATCLQAITLASSARYQSTFIKRISGSGVIQMTMDNGTTWTAVTVTSSWTPVGIPTQTLANPTVGFRIVTSGDAIAIDMVMNENGAYRTSPIATTGVTVTRIVDDISLSGTLFPLSATQGILSIKTQYIASNVSVNCGVGLYGPNTQNLADFRATQMLVSSANVTQAVLVAGSLNTSMNRRSLSYATNDFAGTFNGGTVVTDVSGSTPVTLTILRLHIGSTAIPLNGHLNKLLYLPRNRASDAELQGFLA